MSTQLASLISRQMKVLGYTPTRLSVEMGVPRETVYGWKTRGMVPFIKNAAKLAEILDSPAIATMVLDIRTITCQACGKVFTVDGVGRKHKTAVACSRKCGYRRTKMVERTQRRVEIIRARDSLEAQVQEARDERDAALSAIARFCRSCEWDGICKTPTCELRDESPLPLEGAA